jgi:hypothetical protein
MGFLNPQTPKLDLQGFDTNTEQTSEKICSSVLMGALPDRIFGFFLELEISCNLLRVGILYVKLPRVAKR